MSTLTPTTSSSQVASPNPSQDLVEVGDAYLFIKLKETMMSKEHAMLLSVFLLFKCLSKDLIIPALFAYYIRGIDAIFVMLPPIKRFRCSVTLPPIKRFRIKEVYVGFNESWFVVSIPGLFFCMWYAAKKYCVANNVLRNSSRMQGIEMLPLGPLKIGDILLVLGKVWDWTMYGVQQKRLDGWFLHTANGNGERDEDDVATIPEDRGDGPEDDGNSGGRGPEDHDNGLDGSGMNSEDFDDEIVPLGQREPDKYDPLGERALQVLAVSANFPIDEINGHDGRTCRRIYLWREGEVRKEGMADLVPTGPHSSFSAYGGFIFEVIFSTTTASNEDSSTITEGRDVCDNDEIEEYTYTVTEGWDVSDTEEIEEYRRTIYAGLGRELEMTYLVIPNAIEAKVEVRLKFKDLGSRSCAVYGKIKASATDYGNKSVHLFNCERGAPLSFPSGSTSVLPLGPSCVAVPCRWQLELNIEVDLTIMTTCDSRREQDKNLKFSLEFTREIICQRREVDDDKIEVNIRWLPVE